MTVQRCLCYKSLLQVGLIGFSWFLSRSQITWTMWPARILLDPRVSDKDALMCNVKASKNCIETADFQDAIIFRCVWYVFLAVLGLPLLFAAPPCLRPVFASAVVIDIHCHRTSSCQVQGLVLLILPNGQGTVTGREKMK